MSEWLCIHRESVAVEVLLQFCGEWIEKPEWILITQYSEENEDKNESKFVLSCVLGINIIRHYVAKGYVSHFGSWQVFSLWLPIKKNGKAEGLIGHIKKSFKAFR